MQHPITKETVRLTLSADYDYLTAGETYLATPSRPRSGKRRGVITYWRIDRTDETSGTFLCPFQWQQMLSLGIAAVTPA